MGLIGDQQHSPYTGFYTIPAAARLVELRAERVRRWVRGSESGVPGVRREPLLQRDLETIDGEYALSFLDLIEVRMVRLFLDHGVGIHTIRAAARTAAELFSSRHPFCIRKFQTDGRTVFATLAEVDADVFEGEPREPLMDLATKQTAIRHVLEPLLHQIDYENDIAASWWSMGRDAGVVIDPRIAFGAPVVASCGIPTETLADPVDAGRSCADVADWFGVTPFDVECAVAFERRLAASAA